MLALFAGLGDLLDTRHFQNGEPAMSTHAARTRFDERRRGGRVRCDLTSTQYGPVLNISRTGLRVLSRRVIASMPPGASTALRVSAAGRTMTVPGRAVHNRPRPDGLFEVGFQFVGITEATARDLIELARTAFDGSVVYDKRKSA